MIPELASAVHTVEVTIDAIRDIANSTLPNAENDATHSSTDFRNLTLDVGSFGDSPLGKELGRQHKGAHEVFVETIRGTIEDLQEFRQKLLDAMDNHESTDAAAQAMLLSISKKYDGHEYQSDHNYNQARTDQSDNLRTSSDPSTPAFDTTAPATSTEPAPPATPTDPVTPAPASGSTSY